MLCVHLLKNLYFKVRLCAQVWHLPGAESAGAQWRLTDSPLDQGLRVLAGKEGGDVFGQCQVVTQVTELVRQFVCPSQNEVIVGN